MMISLLNALQVRDLLGWLGEVRIYRCNLKFSSHRIDRRDARIDASFRQLGESNLGSQRILGIIEIRLDHDLSNLQGIGVERDAKLVFRLRIVID